MVPPVNDKNRKLARTELFKQTGSPVVYITYVRSHGFNAIGKFTVASVIVCVSAHAPTLPFLWNDRTSRKNTLEHAK